MVRPKSDPKKKEGRRRNQRRGGKKKKEMGHTAVEHEGGMKRP